MAVYLFVGSSTIPWEQIVMWTTFGVMDVREAILVMPSLVAHRFKGKSSAVHSLAVVVPTLNESRMLSNCLFSVARMSPRPDELIVVDGGSIDGTGEIAVRSGATVVSSEPGRGHQIAAGVASARSEVVLVLHADSEVIPDTGSRIFAALNTRADAVGGAIGQQFDRDAPSLCVIECLNEITAMLLGLPSGDQGQFFRRAAIMAGGGFPNLPLMENVALSLRLRTAVPILFLRKAGIYSHGGLRQVK